MLLLHASAVLVCASRAPAIGYPSARFLVRSLESPRTWRAEDAHIHFQKGKWEHVDGDNQLDGRWRSVVPSLELYYSDSGSIGEQKRSCGEEYVALTGN